MGALGWMVDYYWDRGSVLAWGRLGSSKVVGIMSLWCGVRGPGKTRSKNSGGIEVENDSRIIKLSFVHRIYRQR